LSIINTATNDNLWGFDMPSLLEFVIPINLFSALLLAALLISLSRGYLPEQSTRSVAFQWVGLSWLLNAYYLAFELHTTHVDHSDFVFTLMMVGNLCGSFCIGFGSIVYILRGKLSPFRKPSLLAYTIVFSVAIITIIISSRINSALSDDACRTFVSISTPLSTLGLILYFFFLRSLVKRESHFSATSLRLLTWPILIYIVLQFMYFAPTQGTVAEQLQSRTLGFSSSLFIKLMHMIGLAAYAISRVRDLQAELSERREYQAAIEMNKTFVTEMAHEIGNPAGILRLQVEALSESLSNTRRLKEIAGRIADATVHITAILNGAEQILKWGSLEPNIDEDTRVIPVNNECQAAIIAVKSRKANTIDIDRGLKPTTPPARVLCQFSAGAFVLARPSDIAQIVGVLLNNAFESLDSGSNKIFVRTSVVGPTRDVVRIEVEDTGVGIPAVNIPRVFEVNFTTKSYGKGVGLGRAKEIANSIGGIISIASPPPNRSRGTIVRLDLPIADDDEEE